MRKSNPISLGAQQDTRLDQIKQNYAVDSAMESTMSMRLRFNRSCRQWRKEAIILFVAMNAKRNKRSFLTRCDGRRQHDFPRQENVVSVERAVGRSGSATRWLCIWAGSHVPV